MTPSFSLSVLLIFSVGFAIGQEEPAHSNVSPTEDEWTEERIDALLAERENGRPLHEVKGEVDFQTRSFNKHVRNGNCGGIIRMYDPNAMMVGYDGTVTKGLETVHMVLDVMKNVADLNMTTVSVTPLGKNARFVFQHENFNAVDANGKHVASGETFIIWKRHENGLRLFMEIYDEDSFNM